MPSFEEGFGIPVLEAMTFGVPVVASARGSLPEVLGDAGPLVNPDEPDEIAGAMARVLDDDAYASACAAKGVLRARQFNWNRTARLVYDVYRQAVEDRQSAGRRSNTLMRIGIDARELSGHATGVGRFLGGLLREWSNSSIAGAPRVRPVRAGAARDRAGLAAIPDA